MSILDPLPSALAALPERPTTATALAVRAAAPAAIAFKVQSGLDLWWKVDPPVRAEVTTLLEALELLHAAPNKRRESDRLAQLYPMRGMSGKSLRRKYNLYVKGGYRSDVRRPENYFRAGDWRCLVDAWHVREGEWPQAFKDRLAFLVVSNQRKASAAIRQLNREWEQGKDIPGIGTWQQRFRARFGREPGPKCPPNFTPWSDRTLYRLIPEDALLALGRQGLAAAEEHFAQLSFDPSTLRPFEVVFIDDWFANFKVRYENQITYAMGLAALDWGTRCWVHWCLGARAELADGTRRALSAEDMALFIVELLRKIGGLPEDYAIHLVVENHTASVTQEYEQRIKETFGDRVRIVRSGLLNGRVLSHGFAERGGKWRTKAPVESGFNLLKNECASLPGQRGSKERLNAPADLAARESWAVKVLEDDDLPEEYKAWVARVFLPLEEAKLRVDEIFDRINQREWHRLKGFRRLYFWRLSEADDWTPVETAPTPEQRAAIDAGAEVLDFDRPESPLERLRHLAAGLKWQPIAPAALVPLGARCEPKVTVTQKGEIVITDKRRGVWRFYSADARFSGLLQPGAEYRGFFLEDDPTAIFLTPRDELRILGWVPRFGDVAPFDQAAKAAAYAQTRGVANSVVAELRRIMAPADAELQEVREKIEEGRTAVRAGVTMGTAAVEARTRTKRQSAEQRDRNARRAAQAAARAAAQLGLHS